MVIICDMNLVFVFSSLPPAQDICYLSRDPSYLVFNRKYWRTESDFVSFYVSVYGFMEAVLQKWALKE